MCQLITETLEQLLLKTFALSFDRSKGKYVLLFDGEVYEQNVCEFLQTVSFLVGKDVEEYLLNTDSRYDSVRIPLTGCGKLITLSLSEFISFREVYAHEMFMLRLEDLLLRQGVHIQKPA